MANSLSPGTENFVPHQGIRAKNYDIEAHELVAEAMADELRDHGFIAAEQ